MLAQRTGVRAVGRGQLGFGILQVEIADGDDRPEGEHGHRERDDGRQPAAEARGALMLPAASALFAAVFFRGLLLRAGGLALRAFAGALLLPFGGLDAARGAVALRLRGALPRLLAGGLLPAGGLLGASARRLALAGGVLFAARGHSVGAVQALFPREGSLRGAGALLAGAFDGFHFFGSCRDLFFVHASLLKWRTRACRW